MHCAGWEALGHDAAIVDRQRVDHQSMRNVIVRTHRAGNEVLQICRAPLDPRGHQRAIGGHERIHLNRVTHCQSRGDGIGVSCETAMD